jgi:hypothetical protein
MPSRNTDVFVIEVNGECRVRPAVYLTDLDGDHAEFKIRNLTNWDVTVLLPQDLVSQGSPAELRLGRGGKTKASRGHTKLNPRANGVYHYEVIYDQDRRDGNWQAGEGGRRQGFALGESDPIVVADPPAEA